MHWLRFSFTAEQIAAFKNGERSAVLGIAHKNYGHMAVLPDAVRTELAKDFA